MLRNYKLMVSPKLLKGINALSLQRIRTFLSTEIPEVQKMNPGIKTYEDLHKFSVEHPDIFWKALSTRLDWKQDFTKTVEGDFSTGVKWFLGGKLNASVNCVDRHAKTHPDRIALIHEKDEPNQCESISYAQLHDLVVEYAYLLRTVGNIKKGDRVAIYLSCSPTAVAMSLACARLGAIHSIVFAGFSAEALASRINDAQAKVVITSDIAVRGGKVINLKDTVDNALESCPSVKTVLVDLRGHSKSNVKMSHPRDHFIQELQQGDTKAKAKANDVVEYMDSSDPLFILYTSGSTGAPKGIVHSTAGYLLYAMTTHQTVFDFHPGDKFGCVADVGWVTGHSYIMYGPLANGGTTLLFESIPTYPDPGRYWEMVERLKLTHFYGAPTALRVLMKLGTKWVFKYDRSSLRVLGSVGEPINLDAWTWYHDVVGDKKCTLVDTWWQTETGGICLSPRPSAPNASIVPAMAMRPFFGIKPKLIGQDEKLGSETKGPLCIEKPWPGMASSIWNAPERFTETYFSQYKPYYFTGDGAIRNADGHWRITGRMDDVINVTGHRLGTAEVEEALARHKYVSESAVVGFPHDIKGEGIFAFVVMKDKADVAKYRDNLEKELRSLCKSHVASFAIPDYILFSDSLPKTRSGKIMRRILRKIAAGENLSDMGDITTLAEPAVVEALIEHRASLISEDAV